MPHGNKERGTKIGSQGWEKNGSFIVGGGEVVVTELRAKKIANEVNRT